MDPQSNNTFAEIYQLDERKFAGETVNALRLSNRTAKRFRQNGIVTIADLLLKTPVEMMSIEGFGVGCLTEIEQILSTLDERTFQNHSEQTESSAHQVQNETMQNTNEPTLADQYQLSTDALQGIDITSLNFSVRVYNVLMHNGIVTLDLLLQKTMSQLQRLRNFGRTCMEEIDAKLTAIANDPAQVCATNITGNTSVTTTENDCTQIPADAEMLLPNDSVMLLPLTVRTANCLQRANIATITQMLKLSQADMMDIRNMGRKSVQEVLQWQMSLRTGADGYFCMTEADVSEDDAWKPTESQAELICGLKEKLGLEEDRATLILRSLVCNKSVCGETLIYKLYEVPQVRAALRSKVLRILRDMPEGMSLTAIHNKLPHHLGNTTVLEEMLLQLERDGEVLEQEEHYRRKYPTLTEFLLTLPEREQLVLRARINGQSLAEVGTELNITRERVRQLENKALQKRPRLEEDKYLRIFQTYFFSKEDFGIAFVEPDTTYHYLDIVANNKAENRLPLEELLEDDSVLVSVKKQVRRAVYKDYVHLEGQLVLKKRPTLVRYAVQRFAKDKVGYDTFAAKYQELLVDLGIDGDEHLTLNGRTYSNHLAGCDFALWNYNNAFRYYNIAGTDFSEFLETINLQQYENMELSTYKVFCEYPELMKQYDIRDEYELHNLLKKISIPNVNIRFLRMPNFVVGTADREDQALELLIRHAPIAAYDLAEKYEEEYGVRAATALANYFGQLHMYYHDGIYSVDFPALSTEQEQHMNDLLAEDFYPISQVVRLYQREYPGEPTNRINPYSLKVLGFHVYSGYVVRNTYESAKEYFVKLLTEQDVIDLRTLSQDLMYRSSFTVLMYHLRADREIIEFAPKQYINIRKLQGVGYGKEQLQEFCNYVASRVEPGEFFTMESLRSTGFAHDLDDLGFGDYFCSALLAEDKHHFTCRNMGITKLFFRGVGEATMEKFLLWLLEQKQSIEIYDLMELLENKYGIKTDVTDLRVNAQSAGLYYDSIMKKIYIDYDTYFEEI